MMRQTMGTTPFFFSPNLAPYTELLHAVSTRHGGVSTGCYRSLNLSFHVGDEEDKVLHNYHLLSRVLKFDICSLVTCEQVHHNSIALIDETYLNKNCFLSDSAVPETDGLATNVPGITLLTRYADCVPLLFYNQKRQTVAIAHAGWKGTLAGIGPLMTDLLRREFKCRPEQTIAAIGPSIGPCCYHISSSMADQTVKEIPLAEKCILASAGQELSLDLWQLNRSQLIASGIQEDHISSAGLCTSCTVDHFFSYRKEAKVTGRFGALIGLKG
jgi:YfiH family protein